MIIEFNTTDEQHIYDSFGMAFNYQLNLIDGTPNPESLKDFTNRLIGEYIISVVKFQDIQIAKDTAVSNIKSILLTNVVSTIVK